MQENKIKVPEALASGLNVATSYRSLQAGDEVTLKVEGGAILRKLTASAVVYKDRQGTEFIVFDDDE